MKVISILQPWASLVVIGAKKIETRSWNTKYRGDILIHASLGKKALKSLYNPPFSQLCFDMIDAGIHPGYEFPPTGAIIGKVNIVETAPTKHFLSLFGDNPKTGLAAQLNAEQEKAFGDFSEGRYGWLLSDPVKFKNPIPAKGKLGLWDYENEEIYNYE